MAWGHGGGGFGGGAVGAGPGHGFAARPEGLPFAGIPPELADGVEELLATEAPRGEPDVTFTHQVSDRRPIAIRRLLAGHRLGVLACLVVAIIEVVSLQSGPYLTQLAIDRGILAHHVAVLIVVGVAYLMLVGLGALASSARIALAGRVAAWINKELRVRVFSHLQRLSLDFFTGTKAGVVMTRMTSDIEALSQFFQDGLVQFAIQTLTLVLVTAILLADNLRLTLVTILLILPALTALSLWFRSASDRSYSRVRDGIANVLSDLSESLAGLRVIVAFNRQWRNIVGHRNVVGQYQDASNESADLVAVYGATTDFLGLAGQAAVLAIGGHMVLSRQLSVGELTAFVLYLSALFTPVQQLVQQYNSYQQSQAAVSKLHQLLATTPSVPESPGARDLARVSGEIIFDHVTFGYEPAAPVLHDIDLRIAPGETVAIVGETGAGKSTIAKLVARFYDPDAGRVLIDGHDLRTVTIASLRHQLGVVPQEPYLFAGTIRDNIAFARPEAPDVDVARAAGEIGLDIMLDSFPDGIDTRVSERGVSLSSGQRQMVALARAFLADPAVLVLDEATSNLDLRVEDNVNRAFDLLLRGRTAIIVAHRISTAAKADRIFVVDRGRIVESGTPAELLGRPGRYAEMVTAWEHRRGAGAPVERTDAPVERI